MADNRTMEELLQAPTEGYREAIVILKINADHFEIKTNLLQLVQVNPYHGFERENIHTHINNFKRITSTLKFRDVSNDVIRLMMFPYSLEGAARVWENASKTDDRIDKLADQISTLVDIFAKKVVTPAPFKAVKESCVTCGGPHAHYNCDATNSNQPSVCVATGTYNQVAPQNRASNYMAPPCFAPVQNSQNREFKNEIQNTMKTQQNVLMEQQNALQNNLQNMLSGFFQNQASTSGTLPSNTIPNPKGEMKGITTHSGVGYKGPLVPTNLFPKKVVKRETDETTDKEQTNFQGTMLLKKLPKKLGDTSKFLIPRDFPGMDVCHALADLGASINLMPLSIWKKLSLPELTPTRMIIELLDRSITRPKGVVKDVFIKVGKFHFLTHFLVVDFETNPRVPLILGRSFLRTGRALIDVYGEEITLRVNDEAVTFNLNQTTRYSSTYDDLSVNRIDIINVAREEYAQEILAKAKSSIEEPPELELKDLPSHLEYSYLEGVDKLPVIIAKYLKVDEKEALLKVIKSHKKAIAWKITDIKDFSKIAKPMTHLLEKVTSFVFSKYCIDAFETLKKKFTKAPILVVPDWNLPFELMCDASDFAIGAVLGQQKMKKLHDSKIKNRIFNVGDQVLLFNSRLKIFSGKLKTHCSRPFTITKVFPYGTVELSQPDGPNFRVNGHRVKHYFRGDMPQLVVPDLQTFLMNK
nr:reverse transcriptase domain-containing protein [Tanacetum cinerariifolium]